MSGFWFPVQEELLFHEDFVKSKPSDKLYYLSLLHYLNLHQVDNDEDMYKRDVEFAATLNYSEDAIRLSRRKFMKMGWIRVTSGGWTRGGNIATTYHNVKFSEIPNHNEGKRFVTFPHYDFQMVANGVRNGILTHEDMVVYCYLVAWNQLKGVPRELFISKKDLREYTNINKAVKCVENIYSTAFFGEESVLESFEDNYHSISIKLSFALSPLESENNRNNFYGYLKDIKRLADNMQKAKHNKEIEKAKSRGEIVETDQIMSMFRKLYKETHEGRSPSIEYRQKRVLFELAEKEGYNEVARIIRKYFELPSDEVPNPTNAKNRTLSRFLHSYDILKSGLNIYN